MKLRFNSLDIVCGVTELQSLVGLRVNQVYDVDNKTYLIRFQGGGESKKVLLIESGIRFHTTAFDWPKNVAPSGFSMKLRKHLKNKRLEKFQQLGVDRIVDFQFGTGEAAYHIIVELYDRGNIVLADHNMTILYILRPHQEGEDVCFTVRGKYPIELAKKAEPIPSLSELRDIIAKSPAGESLRRIIMPFVDCGPTLIEHVLKKYNLENCIIATESIESNNQDGIRFSVSNENKKNSRKKNKDFKQVVNYREFDIENELRILLQSLQDILAIMENARKTVSRGYILQKKEEKPVTDVNKKIEHYYQNVEYHPYKFYKFEGQPIAEFESFMLAVDEFYSSLESQKIDMKTLQKEREAVKKLSNVKKDHAKRLDDLNKAQEEDKRKAELITMNQGLVDNAILAIRSAIANQMSWPDIHDLVKAAQSNSDPVASCIKQLKLEINHIAVKLSDPYMVTTDNVLPIIVDVDLALSAWANARKYYDQKRFAAQKEQKTIDASQKALKSAERKTQQTLKEVHTISTISKARKVYWFEKFYWFISSENFLVIGGRDAQQNELIVKRYMRSADIYVHAEIQGASSVVIRNPNGRDVPPKTLSEAATMAISYSVAWDAKVVTNAYWVNSNQVSKTAPSGEYLGTGSFMIRGKKNFLPSCHLIMGLTLLFKLEDGFVEKHRGDRKVRSFEEDQELLIGNEMESMTFDNENLCNITKTELGDHNDSNADTVKNNKLSTNYTKKEGKSVRNETRNESEDQFGQRLSNVFPDIQLKVEHDTGRITVDNELSKTKKFFHQTVVEENDDIFSKREETEESIIISATPSRKKQQQNSKRRREEKTRKSQKEQNQQMHSTIDTSQNINYPQAVKRGQKGKLKKIKAKYKDQDDEERQMRMQILSSAGKNNQTPLVNNLEGENLLGKISKHKHEVEPKQMQHCEVEEIDDVPIEGDVEILDSLTGQPLEEDELLFVIPMVAPYQALQNYKYKVKITPGTGKRGRAAKTALSLFSKDKACNSREKDLIKSVREETLARNMPGKVKLSAPQLLKFKK